MPFPLSHAIYTATSDLDVVAVIAAGGTAISLILGGWARLRGTSNEAAIKALQDEIATLKEHNLEHGQIQAENEARNKALFQQNGDLQRQLIEVRKEMVAIQDAYTGLKCDYDDLTAKYKKLELENVELTRRLNNRRK